MEVHFTAADLSAAGRLFQHCMALFVPSPTTDAARHSRSRSHAAHWDNPFGSILAASAWTVHFFDHRSLGTVGVPLSRPWLQETLIGLLVGSIPPLLFFLAAYKLDDAQVARVPLDLHRVLTQSLPALAATLLLAFHEELLYRGYLLQLISQKTGRMVAALVTGAIFGLAHGGNSAANPQGRLSRQSAACCWPGW
jgi:membrane protease YdiL (CAAX protease family)